MDQKNNSKINIGKVSGDVVFSQDQKNGITMHDFATIDKKTNRKSFYKNKYVLFLGLVATVLTILSYLGVQPKLKKVMKKSSEITKNSYHADTITIQQMHDKENKLLK